jgi:hypothetical protein
MTTTRNLQLDTWDEGSTQPYLPFNELLTAADALIQCCVEAITASPPSSPDIGKAWIVDAAATGVWVGHVGDIAVAVEGGWVYYTPGEGWEAYVRNGTVGNYQFVSGVWALQSSGGSSSQTVAIQLAASDEVTPITAGTSKVTFRSPYAFTLTGVRASLSTASSSGLPTFDINMNGTSILSTKLTIDVSEKTSVTAATPAVISTTAITDDAEITVDFDLAGTGATGVKITLLGTKTS